MMLSGEAKYLLLLWQRPTLNILYINKSASGHRLVYQATATVEECFIYKIKPKVTGVAGSMTATWMNDDPRYPTGSVFGRSLSSSARRQ